MSRLKSMLKAVCYKLRYGKSLQWEAALRCEKVSEIKILTGNLKIGKGFRMNTGSYIAVVNGGQVTIGNHVSINRNSILVCHDCVTIEEHCSIGPNVLIYDHDHCFGPGGLQEGYRTSPVVIHKNCWIGGGVTILRGTTIGEGCVIGAGAVIKGEIPPHSLVTSDRELMIRPLRENEKPVFYDGEHDEI